MGRLKHITFTGINIFKESDLRTLIYLQEQNPLAEFGVLCSEDWEKNGSRFMAPFNFHLLAGKGLNLSAHLCGSLAKEAIRGNWGPFDRYCNGYSAMFKRVQLNVSREKPTLENIKVNPQIGTEIIIQAKNLIDYSIFSEMVFNNSINNNISMLVDSSGGRGKLLDWEELKLQIKQTQIPLIKYKIGYAGGLNEYTAPLLVHHLCEMDEIGDFWIDMESSLRVSMNPKEFDFNKVEVICREIKKAVNDVLCNKAISDHQSEVTLYK